MILIQDLPTQVMDSNFSLIIKQKEKKHVMRGKWFNVFLIVQ
jgi:hypothetical protein